MSTDDDQAPARLRWARLRFSIIGQLLSSPPEPGDLTHRIADLADQKWRHPTSGEVIHLSAKTIERMYYAVRTEADPFAALERKTPKHAGTHPSVSPAFAFAIQAQYRDHPGWTYQLHYDNLVVVANESPSIGPIPGYATVRRFMKDHGLFRQKKKRRKGKEGEAVEVVPREVRSYETAYVNALWHYDFHEGKRKVVTPSGERKTPYLFGLLDDCSRVCCHAQWYLDRENTEDLVHGLSQGIQKRKIPRSTMSDNGSPMISAEIQQGHDRLGMVQHLTLPRTPEQNGKQEHFWTQVEGRLMPMLEGEPELTLELLNRATQAWVEQEYHRSVHSEIKMTPIERYLKGPDVGRESPSSDELRRVFRMEMSRRQRRSDGTCTVQGVRFEVPSAYRALSRLRLWVARWDLSSVHLIDPRKDLHLATLYPIDKVKNADGARRALPEVTSPPESSPKPAGIAPLLRALMADYAATGLPPAYLPKSKKISKGDD
jgi:transposase InsO family protein